MNNFILMAKIVRKPELRYTQDNKMLTEMLVEFENAQGNETSGIPKTAILKVVGWGNLAKEIEQNYHEGDRVILAGRLSMVMVTRQDYSKEKIAEMMVNQIYHQDSNNNNNGQSYSEPESNRVVSMESYKNSSTTPVRDVSDSGEEELSTAREYENKEEVQTTKPALVNNSDEEDLDDIPF